MTIPAEVRARLCLKKGSKYHAVKQKCFSGHLHDSKVEANYCDRLLAAKQAREIKDYKIQVPFELYANGQLICVHVVDFLVALKEWNPLMGLQSFMEVHEVKGFKTRDWQIKVKLFKANYPGVPYRIISKETKNGKIRK